MASTTNELAGFEELKREVVNQYHDFREWKYLFYGPPKRVELLNAVARHFFGELYYAQLGRIVLGVSKLTDPAGSGSRQNLSFALVHRWLCADHRYPEKDAAKLITQADVVRDHVALWRSKLVAHKDAAAALGTVDIGEVVPSEIEGFYAIAGKYLDLVSQALGLGPCPIDATAYHGADELVRSLKRAMAFEDLLEKDVLKYRGVLEASKYVDT
jgi:hypothetical protein